MDWFFHVARLLCGGGWRLCAQRVCKLYFSFVGFRRRAIARRRRKKFWRGLQILLTRMILQDSILVDFGFGWLHCTIIWTVNYLGYY